jgi:general secretion pathway protein L
VGYGWSVISREQSFINVTLVIVSMSAVMAYLVRQYDVHDSHAQEVWASVDGSLVVVGGFGEQVRANLYRKRLLRCVAMSAVGAALLFCIMAISTAFKGLEAQRFEAMNAAVQSEAADASRLRESLVSGNTIITAANEVLTLYPNPHVEIARLTRLLGDDVSIAHFSMVGDEIRLRGRAVDAASVMQLITKEPAYAEVTSPQAISRVGNTGFEQFSLNIRLGEGDSG